MACRTNTAKSAIANPNVRKFPRSASLTPLHSPRALSVEAFPLLRHTTKRRSGRWGGHRKGTRVVRGAAAGAGLLLRAPEPSNRAYQAFDPSDWAWEFLRRNGGYQADWRAATPRTLPCAKLRDGTMLLRLRRRYLRAERWGLYAFADPFRPAPKAPVFWLPAISRRTVRARCDMVGERANVMRLARFRAQRSAVIGVDGVPVVTMKSRGFNVGLVASGWHVLTRPAAVTFELDRFDELTARIECLRILQRLTEPGAPESAGRSSWNANRRLLHALVALDGSLGGQSYREIAMMVFGQKRVTEDWTATSRFLKDRTRRLVTKGHELMNGGYRDLLR